MVDVHILAVIPELLEGPFQHSILKRAADRNLLSVTVHDLKQWGSGRHHQIDDYQYGGGAGMVLMVEPLYKAISELSEQHTFDEIIYLTPDGEPYQQSTANSLSMLGSMLLICGHYKGIDERIREQLVTKEISIGDYVLSGGELAAAVMVDSIGRLIPGVLNDETSALEDSFQNHLLSHPVYTRPAEFQGWKVPNVLLSGHEAKITAWREEQAYLRTKSRRPDLLDD